MKVKILMTKVITISTRGSLAGRTTMCSQETRTRVQRTFAILVSAEIERSVVIGSYYLFCSSIRCWNPLGDALRCLAQSIRSTTTEPLRIDIRIKSTRCRCGYG